MTVAYAVSVPRGTVVRTNSDSGETTIAGVSGKVSVRTESASIRVRDLSGDADVTTQSGSVDADSVGGNLDVTTQSSRVSVRNLGAGLRVRTQSGAVEGTFRGQGNVDVGTGSSAIDLVGVNGGLTATSNSGRIRVSGLPTAPWQVTSGSGSFELDFDSNAKLTLDARSGSGSVRVDGSALQGSTSKGAASGTVGGGGPLVRANIYERAPRVKHTSSERARTTSREHARRMSRIGRAQQRCRPRDANGSADSLVVVPLTHCSGRLTSATHLFEHSPASTHSQVGPRAAPFSRRSSSRRGRRPCERAADRTWRGRHTLTSGVATRRSPRHRGRGRARPGLSSRLCARQAGAPTVRWGLGASPRASPLRPAPSGSRASPAA